MKILLDVNVSRAAADSLTKLGHDVVCVADIDPRMPDDGILDWAMRERRVIITTDMDFEEMIWRVNRPHFGVLRLENLPRSSRLKLLQEAILTHRDELEDGAIVLATRRQTRIRRA